MPPRAGGGDSHELLRALDAELIELNLRDAELVRRLRDAVARQVHDGRVTAGADGALSPTAAAEVCVCVLRAVSGLASVPERGHDPATEAKFAELAEIQRELFAVHRDPRLVEHQTFRELLRAFAAGRTRR